LKNIDCFSAIDEIYEKSPILSSIPELLGFGSKNPAVILVDK
jgi:hypothetical protein